MRLSVLIKVIVSFVSIGLLVTGCQSTSASKKPLQVPVKEPIKKDQSVISPVPEQDKYTPVFLNIHAEHRQPQTEVELPTVETIYINIPEQ